MDYRFARVLRPVAALTAAVFTIATSQWSNLAFAAQDYTKANSASVKSKSASERLGSSLLELQATLDGMDSKLSKDKDITPDVDNIGGLWDTLQSEDQEARAEFEQTEKFLRERNLPSGILQRHNEAV